MKTPPPLLLILLLFVSCTPKVYFGVSFKPKDKVAIVSFGYKPTDTALGLIKNRLRKIYHIKSTYIGEDTLRLIDSLFAYAPYFETDLKKYITKRHTHVIGLTDRELLTFRDMDIHFLYGQSWDSCSIISNSKEGDYDGDTVNNYTVPNIVAHELGHQFSMSHCEDSTCLMYSAGYISDSVL